MVKNIENPTVADIFRNAGINNETKKNIRYQIPKYQREYTWKKSRLVDLFTDLIDNEKGYFLGTIILVKSGDNKDIFEIIDGQQRITSLSILLLVIYERLKLLPSSNETQKIILEITNQLVLKKDNNLIPRLELQDEAQNNNDYKYLLGTQNLVTLNKNEDAELRLIFKSYQILKNLLNDYISTNAGTSELKLLKTFYQKIKAALFVSVEVKTYSDAYLLFEGINNRGEKLISVDLIKNVLISTADKQKLNIEDIYNKWNNLVNDLGEDLNDRERFFRQFYNAFRDDLNHPFGNDKYYLGRLATKNSVLPIFEKLIKKDLISLLTKLEKEAQIYALLIGNTNTYNYSKFLNDYQQTFKISDNELNKLLKSISDLIHIQGAPSYILLLYLFSNQQELKIKNNLMIDIINYLVIFFVRRNLTNIPGTKDLIKIFMDLVDQIKMARGSQILIIIKDYLKEKSAPDTLFKDKLNGDLYLTNKDATKFLLCYYEAKYFTNETKKDLWCKKNKVSLWSIEHIFPKGQEIPECWVKMIGAKSKQEAQELQKQYVHKLGNLTLTLYNSTLSNDSFITKRDLKDDNNNYIGYKNGLKLNQKIATKNEWTTNDIQKRTKELSNWFFKEFNLD